jgi:hypothetical protein
LFQAGDEAFRRVGQDLLVRAACGEQDHGGRDGETGQRGGIAGVGYDGDERGGRHERTAGKRACRGLVSRSAPMWMARPGAD